MMGGPEEGIYASSVFSNIGIQQTDHGLTLSPKIQSKNVFFFDDTCVLGDDDFESALERSPSRQIDEEQIPSSILGYRVNLLDDFRPAKRRKASTDVPRAPIPQRITFDSVAETRSQPQQETCVLGSFERLATDQRNVSEKDCASNDREESAAHEVDEAEDAVIHLNQNPPRAHQHCQSSENSEYRGPYALPSVEKCQLKGHDFGRKAPGLVYSVVDPVDQKRTNQNALTSADIGRPEIWSLDSDSASSVSKSPRTRISDSDILLPSIERAHDETGRAISLGGTVGPKRKKYMSKAQTVALGLANGLFQAPRRAVVLATVPPSCTASGTSAGQDLNHQSQVSSHAPQQPSTKGNFSDTSEEVRAPICRSGSAPVRQIPAPLRRQFDTLVKKFFSDQEFKLSVQSYMMEHNILDFMGNTQDMAAATQNDEMCSSAEIQASATSSVHHDAAKDLNGCSPEKVLSKYKNLLTDYLALQKRELVLREENDKLRDAVSYYQQIATRRSRINPKPEEPMPHERKWKCSYKKANGRSCGKWNEPFMPHSIWIERQACITCGTWRGIGDRASFPVELTHQGAPAPLSQNTHDGVAFTPTPQNMAGSSLAMGETQSPFPNVGSMGTNSHRPDDPTGRTGLCGAPNSTVAPNVHLDSHGSHHGHAATTYCSSQREINNLAEAPNAKRMLSGAYDHVDYASQSDTEQSLGARNPNIGLSGTHDHRAYYSGHNDKNKFMEGTSATSLIDPMILMESPPRSSVSGPSYATGRPKAATPLSTKYGAKALKATTKKVISKAIPTKKVMQGKLGDLQARSIAASNVAIQSIFQKSRKPWQESASDRSFGPEYVVIDDSPVNCPERSVASSSIAERPFGDDVPLSDAGKKIDMTASQEKDLDQEFANAFAIIDAATALEESET